MALTSCSNTCAALAEVALKKRREFEKRRMEGLQLKAEVLDSSLRELEDIRAAVATQDSLKAMHLNDIDRAKKQLDDEVEIEKGLHGSAMGSLQTDFVSKFPEGKAPSRDSLMDLVAALVLRSKEPGVEAALLECDERYTIDNGQEPDDIEALSMAILEYKEFPVSNSGTAKPELEVDASGNNITPLRIEVTNQLVSRMRHALALDRINDEDLWHILQLCLLRAHEYGMANYVSAFVDVGFEPLVAVDVVAANPMLLEKNGFVSRPEKVQAEQMLAKAEASYKTFQDQLNRGNKLLTADLGPGDFLYAMYGKCFSAHVKEYRYEVCGGGDAKQNGVLLGSFSKLEVVTGSTSGGDDNHSDPLADYQLAPTYKLHYTGGEKCWGAPARHPRSFTLTLQCDTEVRLFDIEEPGICEYVGTLATPLAC